MTKIYKHLRKEPSCDDSKSAKLAKIIYIGLVRLKRAKESLKSGRNSRKRLDFGRERRVNVSNGKFDQLEKKL